jgi:hypothetical protein
VDIEELFIEEMGGAAPGASAPSRPHADHAPPAGLGSRERRLWRVEQRIESLSRMLAKAEAEGNMARIGPLSGELRKWLAEQATLSPPEPATKEDEEERWKAAAASAVAKIERGVRAAEGSATCRHCGAACASCGVASRGASSGA